MDTRIWDNLNNTETDYIAPFLWLRNEDDAEFLAEIDRIYDCGIRSICLESRTHEEFCRDDWWSDVAVILEKCRKKHKKIQLEKPYK